MRKTRHILMRFPEYYLIVLAILAAYSPPFTFNPFLAGLAVIPILQILVKNKISGLIIAGLFLMANLYLLGALLSEFNDFKEFNNRAKQLLLGGLSLWCFNMVASGIMLHKYTKPENVNNNSITYNTQEA